MRQNTPEWLAMRKNKIGASDVPIILGESPYKTPLRLYEEKRGEVEPDAPSQAMLHGHDMEHAIINRAEELLDTLLFPTVVIHPEYPWLMASLDGLSLDRGVAVEAKAWGKERMAMLREGDTPRDTWMQCQIHMACTGLNEEMLIAAEQGTPIIQSAHRVSLFDVEKTTAHVMIYRDQDWIDENMPKLKEFYGRLQEGRPPEATDRDVQTRYDDEWQTLAREIRELENIITPLTEKFEAKRKRLIDMSQGYSCKGGGLTLRKYARKGTVQYTNIPELQGIDLEQYRGAPTTAWRLTFDGTADSI